MIKESEIQGQDSTLNRSAADEPLFILCGRDSLAPEVVSYWIYLAERSKVPEKKIREARMSREGMLRWQMINGSKLPD